MHWLPPRTFRALLRTLGQNALAEEENLNLLARSDLKVIAEVAGISDARIEGVRLLGWRTNLILTAFK
jgi:hypothetical protein